MPLDSSFALIINIYTFEVRAYASLFSLASLLLLASRVLKRISSLRLRISPRSFGLEHSDHFSLSISLFLSLSLTLFQTFSRSFSNALFCILSNVKNKVCYIGEDARPWKQVNTRRNIFFLGGNCGRRYNAIHKPTFSLSLSRFLA